MYRGRKGRRRRKWREPNEWLIEEQGDLPYHTGTGVRGTPHAHIFTLIRACAHVQTIRSAHSEHTSWFTAHRRRLGLVRAHHCDAPAAQSELGYDSRIHSFILGNE